MHVIGRAADEVGIRRSIERDYLRRNLVVVGAWMLGVDTDLTFV